MNTKKIPLSKPYLKVDVILEKMRSVLESCWISGGPAINEFESKVKHYNVDDSGKYIAISNASVGLEMSLQYYGCSIGDEVIVPSWSWVATGFVVSRIGATPIWCDVNEHGVMTPQDVEKLITNKTKAIIIVHQMGIPCDIDKFSELSKKFNIPIIEDAACAFGSEYKNKKIGNSDNIVIYSFQAKKCLTTGEGGMIVVRSKEEEEWFRSMRVFGTNVSPLERDKANYLLKENFNRLGTNYKISDIQCAVGISHLSYLDEEIQLRTVAAKYYNEVFKNDVFFKENVRVGNIIPDYCTKYNWQNYHIILNAKYNRDFVVDYMRKNNVGCKWDIQAIHLEPVYSKIYANENLPTTNIYHNHGLILPFFAEMTRDDQDIVLETLKKALDANGFEN